MLACHHIQEYYDSTQSRKKLKHEHLLLKIALSEG